MNDDGVIQSLTNKRDSLLEKVNALNVIIDLYRSDSPIGVSPVADTSSFESRGSVSKTLSSDDSRYPSLRTYKEKFLWALKKEQRFLSINEVVEVVAPHERNLDEAKKKLSSAKSNLLRDNSIVKVKAGDSNLDTFYGLDSWLDREGEKAKPKKGYEYDESKIRSLSPSKEVMGAEAPIDVTKEFAT